MSVYLSIVSPMFNEEENIARFIASVKKELEEIGKEWEIIIVDDGSEDRSVDVAIGAKANDERIKIVELGRHFGRGRALREGFSRAKGRYIISIESDNSWNPKEISRVLAELETNKFDIVLVSPYLEGGKLKGVPFYRRLLSRIGNAILGASFYGSFSMVTQMFRGYRREVLDSLILEADDKEIHLEILSKALAVGFRVKEIPGQLLGREVGRSKFKLRKTIESHLIFSFLERPFLLFGFLGALFFLFGLAIGVYFIFLWREGKLNPDRPLMTLFIILMLAGVQMVSFGLLGMMLVNIRREILRVQVLSRLWKWEKKE